MADFDESAEGLDPKTLCMLAEALDEAWRRLEAGIHLNGSADSARTVLAEHLFALARQGERDPERLVTGALKRLTL